MLVIAVPFVLKLALIVERAVLVHTGGEQGSEADGVVKVATEVHVKVIFEGQLITGKRGM